MEKLFDETFSNEDNSIINRNIWFGYLDLYHAHEFGNKLVLDDQINDLITNQIKLNLGEYESENATKINWYFYGSSKTKDAIADEIRPSVMIQFEDSNFIVRVNFSDFDFVMNLNIILDFEKKLSNVLNKLN